MTVLFLIALFVEFSFHYTVALVLFVAASITDILDGTIARKHGLITDFGKLMDPLADKMLICSAFIAFIDLGWMPAWMVIVIVARELAITGLRLLAASKNIVLAAEKQGKNKTITQVVAIIALLVTHSYGDWGIVGSFFGFPVRDACGEFRVVIFNQPTVSCLNFFGEIYSGSSMINGVSIRFHLNTIDLNNHGTMVVNMSRIGRGCHRLGQVYMLSIAGFNAVFQ